MLYAGITPLILLSFNHFFLNETVTELKLWSKSAGNNFDQQDGTSEILRNETVKKIENIKGISEHTPKHLKPINDKQFGYYLAGLIEGDGHFSNQQQLVIVFNILDVSLAYYIKGKLGFGTVRKIKNKNAYLFIISSKPGIEKTLRLINGKIRTENKFNQINNILNSTKYADLKKELNMQLNLSKNLQNH